MNSFTDALNEKIAELEDEKSRIDDKIELLQELLSAEANAPDAPAVARKRGGRPKGSRNKKASIHAIEDSIFEESTRQLAASGQGTTPEEQARFVKKFKPVARAGRNYGGVHAGTKAQVEAARTEAATAGVNSQVSVGDENGTVQR
jgi:hypothetical protein